MSLESDTTQPVLNPDTNRRKGWAGKWEPRERRNTNFNADINSRSLNEFWVAQCGRDTLEFERIARLYPRAKMALRIITDATFWTPTEILTDERNDYANKPHYKEWDEILKKEIEWQYARFQSIYQSLLASRKSMLNFGMSCGFTIAYPVWQPVNGRWAVVALKVKKPWEYDPWVDDYGNLTKLWHYPTGQYLNPNEYIFAVWPFLHGENYLGMSEIEPIKAEVELLLKNKSALNQYIHNTSVLGTTLEYDVEAHDDVSLAAAIQTGKSLQSDSLVPVPVMYDLTTGEKRPAFQLGAAPSRASAPVLDQLAKQLSEDDKTITRTIGIGDDLGVTTTQGGAFAKSKTVFDVFLARPYNAQRWLCDLENMQLIRRIIQFNYPSMLADSEYLPPYVAFQTLDDEEDETRSRRIISELQAGLTTLAEGREELGKPPLPGDAEKVSPLADAYPEVALVNAGILDSSSRDDVNWIRRKHGIPVVSEEWVPLIQREAGAEVVVANATNANQPTKPEPPKP